MGLKIFSIGQMSGQGPGAALELRAAALTQLLQELQLQAARLGGGGHGQVSCD